MGTRRGCSSCSRTPIRRLRTAGSPRSWSSAERPGSPWGERKTRSASGPAARANSSSKIAGSRRARCSGCWARATGSPSNSWTRAGSASGRKWWAWRGPLSVTRSATYASGSSSAGPSRSSSSCRRKSLGWRPTSRRPACSSTTPRGCATPAGLSSSSRPCRSSSPPRRPNGSRRRPSTSTGATASRATSPSRSSGAMPRWARSTRAQRTFSC